MRGLAAQGEGPGRGEIFATRGSEAPLRCQPELLEVGAFEEFFARLGQPKPGSTGGVGGSVRG